jgi:ElaB/YqjD/DUF883 family membrane-anchored ribosome-binding protein
MTSQNGLTGEKLNERIDSLTSGLKNAAEHVSTAAASFKERASEAKTHAAARASAIARRVGRAIQDHPFVAAGVALGAGYLVMRLIRR